MKPRRLNVKIAIPLVGEISGEWEPDEAESKAAWELYVELITRVAVVGLSDDQGSLREAMTSIYSLFAITRDILRRYGPQVAPSAKEGQISFGSLAVTVLNGSLRPFLTTWHPRLSSWEATRPLDRAPVDHERAWSLESEARRDLTQVRGVLAETAKALGRVSGAADLVRLDVTNS